jgi:hypothetical protein
VTAGPSFTTNDTSSELKSTIALPDGSWTVLFHLRFFINAPNRTQFDIARGVRRTVLPQLASVQQIQYSSPVAIVFFVLYGLGIIVAFGVIGVIVYFSNASVIKANSPGFSILTVVGIILGYLSIIVYTSEPTGALCTLQIWSISFPLAVVSCSIIVKTYRISSIFNSPRMNRERMIEGYFILIPLIATILIDVAILLIWTFVDPPSPTLVIDGRTAYKSCAVVSQAQMGCFIALIGYHGILLFTAAYLAFRTRKAGKLFKESRWIAYSVYNISVMAVLALAVVTQTSVSLITSYAVRSVAIWICCTGTLALLFVPKILSIRDAGSSSTENTSPTSVFGSGLTNILRNQNTEGNQEFGKIQVESFYVPRVFYRFGKNKVLMSPWRAGNCLYILKHKQLVLMERVSRNSKDTAHSHCVVVSQSKITLDRTNPPENAQNQDVEYGLMVKINDYVLYEFIVETKEGAEGLKKIFVGGSDMATKSTKQPEVMVSSSQRAALFTQP